MKLLKKIDVEMEISNIDIAKSLAADTGKNQSQFLGLFLRCLRDACDDKHRLELQLCGIADNLGVDGKKLISELHGYVMLNNKENG